MYKIIQNNSLINDLEIINKQITDISLNVLKSLNGKDSNYKLSREDVFSEILSLNEASYISMLRSFARLANLSSIFTTKIPKILKISEIYNEPLLISSAPLCHAVSTSIKKDNWFTGYPAHQDWFGARGSKSMLTIWIPVYYTNNQPIHSIGFTDQVSNDTNIKLDKVGDHAYEIVIPDSEFISANCPIGSFVAFDGFQPHKTVVSEKEELDKLDLRIAFSLRFEFADDNQYINSGLSNNYKTSVIKNDDFDKSLLNFKANDKIAARILNNFI